MWGVNWCWGDPPPPPPQLCPCPPLPAPTCNPKAVGRAGARDAEGGGHVLLEEGAPLGEVVVPEEVEGVWGWGRKRQGG